jgi:hypothetical protein
MPTPTEVKVVAAAFVLGLLVFYLHGRSSGSNALPGYKTSKHEPSSPETDWAVGGEDPELGARKLEQLLATRYPTSAHPRRCRQDRSKRWQYVCTDTITGKRRGYDVDGAVIVSGGVR